MTIRYVLDMDQNQFPTEPSTERLIEPVPAAVEPELRKVRYGRRLLIVSIIAYALPLLTIVPSILFVGGFPVGDGMGGLVYVILLGTILAFSMNVVVLAAELTLLIMSIRYLVKGRLTGKTRVAAIVSLIIYSILTGILLTLDALWLVESN
jgi:hypothetical protein